MRIIEHTAPKLCKVKMECDTVIDSKLQEHMAIECCFAKSSTTIVSGGTGSGKTTWVVQMLKSVFKRCFHDIIVCMPENSFNSIAKKDNPFIQIDPENIYHEFNAETLSEIYAKIEENSAAGNFTLFICDDFGADLKQKQNEYILNTIFLKQRHLRVSTLLLVQNWYMVPKKMREIATNLVMFNTNKSQNQKVFKELFDLKDEQFRELMRMLPTAHDYLITNLKYKRIFVDYNEVDFSDE